MKAILIAVALLTFSMSPALTRDNDDRGNDDHGKGYHGAPAPIAGAGLPVIAIGYGVYWIIKRRRNQIDVLKE